MNEKIFWFSGTGSSYWVAKKIHEAQEDSELIPIHSYDTQESVNADVIGVVFPVYAWGPPKMARRFIKNIKANQDAYIFIVLTYAEDCGSTTNKVRRMLKKNGLSLAASYGVRMPNNYPPLYKESDTLITNIYKNADDKIREIIAKIKEKLHGNYEYATFSKKVMGALFYSVFLAFFNLLDRLFKVDDKCNGCGICEKICPSKNISIKDSKVVWHHNCEQCFACFHWCPKKAIQFGKKTSVQQRYHFRDVSHKDLL